MANDYYTNEETSQRFVEGELARGADVDAKFDSVETGFQGVEDDMTEVMSVAITGGPPSSVDIREFDNSRLLLWYLGG